MPDRRQAWTASAIDRQSTFLNIAIADLESCLPKPRNSVSLVDRAGEVVLNDFQGIHL